MVNDRFYFTVMLAASCCMLVTGFTLACVRMPSEHKAPKLRTAKWGIVTAVVMLAVLNMVQIAIDPDGDMRYLGGCIALAMSYLQAMLFTMVVLVLIHPETVTRRRVAAQLAGIAAVDTLLVGAYLLLPLGVFFYVYELCILLYVALLVAYTRWYLRSQQHFLKQISTYYEEEEIERGLSWLKRLFWAALAVGVLSLLMLVGRRETDLCLTVTLTLFYALLTTCFVNYLLSAPVILPALSPRQDGERRGGG